MPSEYLRLASAKRVDHISLRATRNLHPRRSRRHPRHCKAHHPSRAGSQSSPDVGDWNMAFDDKPVDDCSVTAGERLRDSKPPHEIWPIRIVDGPNGTSELALHLRGPLGTAGTPRITVHVDGGCCQCRAGNQCEGSKQRSEHGLSHVVVFIKVTPGGEPTKPPHG